MKFKKFNGTVYSCDDIYCNPSYHDGFFIKTKDHEVLKVSLQWEEGRTNNYRFVRGDKFSYTPKDIIWPDSVVEIEIK
ncbi:hypothetical protein ACQ27_gp365 [Klebsiella phage K64-1]|uniref:Uncharacterized protein n=1 Tax=Klebsiella phage vB_KleM_RaK2 TaxID=1147094 RepID=H6X499_9CAUD|nr:hypothetical protein F403_gp243 [Klebsiella phage vB_KleM_RaK2]YP_010843249.1 hypothetical protein ACQ27_gp365 [Klebsiella phage K64-1]AFA44565.1 hypothetical protein RaK2_00292 [Klebsiella phage vB_KleM_RaK2]